MQIRKAVISMAFVLGLAAAMVIPKIRAGDTDELTKFQFNFAKPIEVPGQILPPGTYWVTIKDAQGAQNDQQQNIIAIYNADRSKLVANVPARPVQRKNVGHSAEAVEEKDGVELRIAPGSPNRPATFLAWFYPSKLTGHQFVYSDRDQKRIDEETSQTVVLKAEKGADGNYSASFEQ